MGADYTTAAGVWLLCRALQEDDYYGVEANVLTLGQQAANPVIDGALSGIGAPFVAGSIPALVVRVANLLTTADAFDDCFYSTADESRFGAKKREAGMKLLSKIQSGELDIGTSTEDEGLLILTDLDGDRGSTEIFSGVDTEWASREETREQA
jgi:hypothetical protein